MATGDTALVFNEIMYHPATNEAALEWVELHNQLAVDLDISNWSIDGGIQFGFGSNVVVKGGGYLVVASSPTELMAMAGISNVFGPFTNRLSNSGEKLQLRNNNGRLMSEVDYGAEGEWPVAPDGSGVSLAKLEAGSGCAPASHWTFSAQMGGTPGWANFSPTPPSPALGFNEIAGAGESVFWLELFNRSTNAVDLSGYLIRHDSVTNLSTDYVFPASNISSGGHVAVTEAMLGFHPVSGDKLYLLPPGQSNVLDAVVVKNSSRARWPDATGPWLRPTTGTPGSSNQLNLRTEIVINEIMYDHQPWPATNSLPPQSNPEEWVELYNRGTNSVDLTGWKLSGGVSFNFPAGKILSPDSYLVVANDAAALRSEFPMADIIGNFSGKLSNEGDTIVLEDSTGNPACVVQYFNRGRWPEFAAGGGSSLELRDPNANPMNAESWAASNEENRSGWQTNSYEMVAQTVVGPDYWDDLLLGLLGDGECLIDDLSVIEAPDGNAVQFINNGNFESGAGGSS